MSLSGTAAVAQSAGYHLHKRADGWQTRMWKLHTESGRRSYSDKTQTDPALCRVFVARFYSSCYSSAAPDPHNAAIPGRLKLFITHADDGV